MHFFIIKALIYIEQGNKKNKEEAANDRKMLLDNIDFLELGLRCMKPNKCLSTKPQLKDRAEFSDKQLVERVIQL